MGAEGHQKPDAGKAVSTKPVEKSASNGNIYDTAQKMVTNMFGSLLTCKVINVDPNTPREVPQFSKGNYQYNWVGILVILVPISMVVLGIILRVPFSFGNLCLLAWWGIFNGIGVTAGYHRLYSHRCYTAGWFMSWLTAFAGAGAFQGSIKWWARNHRIHHNYVDTDKDPYNAKRGFFYSHVGWFLMRMDYDLLGTVDVSDLNAHPIVQQQRKYFAVWAALSGIILPVLSSGVFLGEWKAGIFWVAFLKTAIVHQFTFFINSLAHTNLFWATQDYADDNTPHDSWVFSLVTFGEGYHNFHHEFPQDFRNGFRWYHLDATKWYIQVCEALGYCTDLVRTPDYVIERCMLKMQIKHAAERNEEAEKRLRQLEPEVTETYTWDDVNRLVKAGRKLIVIDGYVYDVEKPIHLCCTMVKPARNIDWLKEHPGGTKFLLDYVGKDASGAFNGGVYRHGAGAHNRLPDLCVARLKVKE